MKQTERGGESEREGRGKKKKQNRREVERDESLHLSPSPPLQPPTPPPLSILQTKRQRACDFARTETVTMSLYPSLIFVDICYLTSQKKTTATTTNLQ